MPAKPHSPSLIAWLRIVRVPNLFTVPGDPIVGFLLAAPTASDSPGLWACVLASLCLYMAGLISNDYFDLDEDRRDRPDRPLPSGAVSPRAALVASLLLGAAGLALAAHASMACLLIALLLTLLILTYNVWLKHHRFLGPLNMGLCRSLSILLGSAAVPAASATAAPVIAAAACMMCYVLNVTVIAADETRKKQISARRWMPAAVMAFAFFFLQRLTLPSHPHAAQSTVIVLCWAAALWVALRSGKRLGGTPEPAIVARTIGQFIRALIPFQAAMAAMNGPGSWKPALAIMVLWPFAALLGRRFYSS